MIGYLVLMAISPMQENRENYIHMTKEQLIEIADQIISEDIAEVDIDPEAFDLPLGKPKKSRNNALDEVEFISERSKRQDPIR